MNKHFLKTLKRVCRDVEELAKRGHYEGADTQLLSISAALQSSAHILAEAVKIADYQPQPETPTEPQSEQTAQNQQEAAYKETQTEWNKQEAQP